mmetsp:Transcript_17546/g.70491  ORF Transcript_17546/g.70491 Transcript_17546/m.70491 type:complete len:306 (+) Transcript_17546:53-970(+)
MKEDLFSGGILRCCLRAGWHPRSLKTRRRSPGDASWSSWSSRRRALPRGRRPRPRCRSGPVAPPARRGRRRGRRRRPRRRRSSTRGAWNPARRRTWDAARTHDQYILFTRWDNQSRGRCLEKQSHALAHGVRVRRGRRDRRLAAPREEREAQQRRLVGRGVDAEDRAAAVRPSGGEELLARVEGKLHEPDIGAREVEVDEHQDRRVLDGRGFRRGSVSSSSCNSRRLFSVVVAATAGAAAQEGSHRRRGLVEEARLSSRRQRLRLMMIREEPVVAVRVRRPEDDLVGRRLGHDEVPGEARAVDVV